MALPEHVQRRFWSLWAKVPKPSEPSACWEWPFSRESRGYGRFKVKGQTYKAYRVAYELHHGPFKDGHIGVHGCDNPPCVRPTPRHAYAGTPRQNVVDKITRRRGGFGSLHGRAKLTEGDVAQIRELLRTDTRYGKYSRIARQFGVADSQIHRIASGRGWLL